MNSRPPGRSRSATTPPQRPMSGSQGSEPTPVYTKSNSARPRTTAAAYTSDWTNVASAVVSEASFRAAATAAPEKSRPVMEAPSRASEIVSVPMWHCRCTPRSPETSPSRGRSNRTTSLMKSGSARKRRTW